MAKRKVKKHRLLLSAIAPALILSTVAPVAPNIVNADTIEDGTNIEKTAPWSYGMYTNDYYSMMYRTNGTEITLVEMKTLNSGSYYTSHVHLPDAIEGVPVTRIASQFMSLVTNQTSAQVVSLKLPKDLTYIGSRAFGQAKFDIANLGKLPEKLEYIGHNAFGGLTSKTVTDLVIPKTVKFIGNGAFKKQSLGSGSLSANFIFEEGSMLEYLGDSAISFSHTTDVKLPSTLKYLGALELYYGGSSLDFSNLEYIETLQKNTIMSNSTLKEVKLPKNLRVIEDGAIKSNLTAIELPSSLEFIGTNAIKSVENLPNLEGVGVYTDTSFGGALIPERRVDGVYNTGIGYDITYEKQADGVVLLSLNLTDGFDGTHGGALELPAEIEGLPVKAINTKFTQFLTDLGVPHSTAIKSFVIPASVRYIGEDILTNFASQTYSFAEGSQLHTLGLRAFSKGEATDKKLILPEGLKNVFDYALETSSASDVQLPSTLEIVGSNGLTGLGVTELTLPSSIKGLRPSAFGSLRNATKIIVSEGVTYLPQNVFSASLLKSIELPKSVTYLGYKFIREANDKPTIYTKSDDIDVSEFAPRAEYSNQFYQSVVPRYSAFGNQLFGKTTVDDTPIGEVVSELLPPIVLSNLYDYEDVEGGVKITKYNGAFVRDVVIPPTINGKPVVEIGDKAFMRNATELQLKDNTIVEPQQMVRVESLKIPDTVKKIGSMAFLGQDGIALNIPTALEYLGDYAFYGGFNGSQKNLTFPTTMKYFGKYFLTIGDSFYGKITALNPNTVDFSRYPNLESIGEGAFSNVEFKTATEANLTNLKVIPKYFLTDSKGITKVTGVSAIEEIGDYALNVTTTSNSEGDFQSLRKLGRNSLENWKTTNLEFPSIETIGEYSLTKAYYTSIDLGDKIEILGDAILSSPNKSVPYLVIPASVKEVKNLFTNGSDYFPIKKIVTINPAGEELKFGAVFYDNKTLASDKKAILYGYEGSAYQLKYGNGLNVSFIPYNPKEFGLTINSAIDPVESVTVELTNKLDAFYSQASYGWTTSKEVLPTSYENYATTGNKMVTPVGSQGTLYLHVKIMDVIGRVSYIHSDGYNLINPLVNLEKLKNDLTTLELADVKLNAITEFLTLESKDTALSTEDLAILKASEKLAELITHITEGVKNVELPKDAVDLINESITEVLDFENAKKTPLAQLSELLNDESKTVNDKVQGIVEFVSVQDSEKGAELAIAVANLTTTNGDALINDTTKAIAKSDATDGSILTNILDFVANLATSTGDGNGSTEGGTNTGDGNGSTEGGTNTGDGNGSTEGGTNTGDGNGSTEGGTNTGDGSGSTEGGTSTGDGTGSTEGGTNTGGEQEETNPLAELGTLLKATEKTAGEKLQGIIEFVTKQDAETGTQVATDMPNLDTNEQDALISDAITELDNEGATETTVVAKIVDFFKDLVTGDGNGSTEGGSTTGDGNGSTEGGSTTGDGNGSTEGGSTTGDGNGSTGGGSTTGDGTGSTGGGSTTGGGTGSTGGGSTTGDGTGSTEGGSTTGDGNGSTGGGSTTGDGTGSTEGGSTTGGGTGSTGGGSTTGDGSTEGKNVVTEETLNDIFKDIANMTGDSGNQPVLTMSEDAKDLVNQSVDTLVISKDKIQATVGTETIDVATLDTDIKVADLRVIRVKDGVETPVMQKHTGNELIVTTPNGYEGLQLTESRNLNFEDVTKENWFYGDVADLFNLSIVNGTTATTFAPNSELTRGQFAAMLARSLELTGKTAENYMLSDLEGKWYANDVETLAGLGIVTGHLDGSFKGNATITRQQALAMVGRAIEHLGVEVEGANGVTFKDANKVHDYAKPYVEFLADRKVIQSGADVQLNPKNDITRAQISKVLLRALQLSKFY